MRWPGNGDDGAVGGDPFGDQHDITERKRSEDALREAMPIWRKR